MKIFSSLLMAGMLMTGVANAMSQEFNNGEFNQGWEAAFNKGDLDSLAGMYAAQAVVVPPSQQIISTPRSIQAFWAEKQRNGTSDFRYTPVTTSTDGDRVTQTGTWSANVRSNGVNTRLTGLLTQVIARQDDGSWKIEVQNLQ